jgi:GNAT superfamily N-acetyltransferase
MAANPEIITIARAPADCTEEETRSFSNLVKEGGEVEESTLPLLIPAARALAFSVANGETVAVGAIKRSLETYRQSIFNKAGLPNEHQRFPLELGWFFVSPDFRGQHLTSQLMAALLSFSGDASMYATSRVDNTRMQMALNQFRFFAAGDPYPSILNHSAIQLFLRS